MKMTEEQIEARMEAWYQVITSLDGDWSETIQEFEEGKKLRKQLQKMADKWYSKVKKEI